MNHSRKYYHICAATLLLLVSDHASASPPIGYKDFILGHNYSALVARNGSLSCTMPKPRKVRFPSCGGDINLKKKVEASLASLNADRICTLPGQTIAGQRVHTAELKFYGETLERIDLALLFPTALPSDKRADKLAVVVGALSAKYGKAIHVELPNIQKYVSYEWRLPDGRIFIESKGAQLKPGGGWEDVVPIAFSRQSFDEEYHRRRSVHDKMVSECVRQGKEREEKDKARRATDL